MSDLRTRPWPAERSLTPRWCKRYNKATSCALYMCERCETMRVNFVSSGCCRLAGCIDHRERNPLFCRCRRHGSGLFFGSASCQALRGNVAFRRRRRRPSRRSDVNAVATRACGLVKAVQLQNRVDGTNQLAGRLLGNHRRSGPVQARPNNSSSGFSYRASAAGGRVSVPPPPPDTRIYNPDTVRIS